MSCAVVALVAACFSDRGPPIVVSAVQIIAPVTGSRASVAYFVVENRTAAEVSLRRVGSPQFERVEIHETSNIDGIARMRQIESVKVAGQSQVAFETGGKHIMLLEPQSGVEPGTLVTLEIQIDNNQLLVSATLQERRPLN